MTLVDSRGVEANNDREAGLEDAATDDRASDLVDEGDTVSEDGALASQGVLVLAIVSIACAAAAVAAGSYALWLTRRRAARNALTDVRDILKTCQERMVQLESDLNRLPQGFSSSPAA